MAKAKKKGAAKISPLLRSAFDVLEHGLFHYLRSSTSKDMKFAMLHVDQAIELLLKERVRLGGVSIYKNPKETISMYGAYDILTNQMKVRIPERPDLELLHEERNNIQHKYAHITAEVAAFHVEKAMGFINRFLKDELKVDIKEYIPSLYLDQL